MKKILTSILVLVMIISCSKHDLNNETAKVRYSVTIQGIISSRVIIVNEGDDYVFMMPKEYSYNKVYANGNEVKPNSANEYEIKDITQNILITFNKQYKILLSEGLGYDLEIISNHSNLVNAGESVKFKLIIDPDYNESTPIIQVNGAIIEVVDGQFTVSDINEDILVNVENVKKNAVVVIREEPEIPQQPETSDYTVYSNNDLSWWYRVPSPLNSNIKPTIESNINSLIKQHNGLWMLDTNQKKVVLTMDEGYEYENNTTEILNIAKSKGVVITFFITGGYIDKNPQLVQRMLNEGHVVANHSNKHLRASPALNTNEETFVNDITQLAAKYKALTGKDIINLYRPPEGGYSERSLAITKDLGYKTIFWSFAYRDWLVDDQPNQQEAFDKIMAQLHPGAILLLHAVSDTNVAILGNLIDEIRAQGYTFTTIPT